MDIIDLSHTLSSGMPVYPGDRTVPHIERESSHGPDSHQSSSLRTGCHAGTHIDLPLHFRPGEPALDAFPLDRCVGTARVLDAAAVAGGRVGCIGVEVLAGDDQGGIDLTGVDFLLLRTGWELRWGGDAYYRDWPWLDPALAERIAAADLKGVGLDSPSVDPHGVSSAHDILATAGLINIENLANLSALPDRPFTLFVLPLKLAGAEASPVRAAALIQ